MDIDVATISPKTFHGACHCRTVTFDVSARPTSLSECNCSLCAMKGALYLKVREIDGVVILSGLEALTVYQFNTHRAKHYFCKTCGVHVFHRPRLDPERWSVNARCLEEVEVGQWTVTRFEGRNWEAAARADGWAQGEGAGAVDGGSDSSDAGKTGLGVVSGDRA